MTSPAADAPPRTTTSGGAAGRTARPSTNPKSIRHAQRASGAAMRRARRGASHAGQKRRLVHTRQRSRATRSPHSAQKFGLYISGRRLLRREVRRDVLNKWTRGRVGLSLERSCEFLARARRIINPPRPSRTPARCFTGNLLLHARHGCVRLLLLPNGRLPGGFGRCRKPADRQSPSPGGARFKDASQTLLQPLRSL